MYQTKLCLQGFKPENSGVFCLTWTSIFTWAIQKWKFSMHCNLLTFPIQNVQQSHWVACSFQTRNSWSNYNASKKIKTRPLCDFFLRMKQALNEFGRNFWQVSEIYSETLWFLFSKIMLGELTCLFTWSRIIKLWDERISVLKFASVQILNVKHCTVLTLLCLIMIKWISWSRHQLIFWWAFSFNVGFWPELASPWGGHHSKLLKVDTDKLMRGLSFSGLHFQFHQH